MPSLWTLTSLQTSTKGVLWSIATHTVRAAQQGGFHVIPRVDRSRANFRFYRQQNREQVWRRSPREHFLGNRWRSCGRLALQQHWSHGVTGLNFYSILVAVVGAVIVLVVYHALFRARPHG